MSQTIEEVLSAAISLPPAARSMLTNRLLVSLREPYQEENPIETVLTLTLDSELEERVIRESARQGMSPEQYTIQTLEKHLLQLEQKRRGEKLAAFRAWNEQYDEKEQKETWEYLVRVLDEDRTSDRKLFPEELKGVSW